MRKWLWVSALAILLAFTPGVALAEDGEDEDVLVRVGADVTIAAGETVGTLVVVDGNADIKGTVRHNVVVVNGDAVVSGSVQGNLSVFSGDIDLRSGATVNNVFSVRGDLQRADGVTVSGSVRERDGIGFLRVTAVIFSVLFWVGMTVAVLVSGLLFAAVGGKQLNRAAATMTGDAVNTVIGAVFLWVGVPVVAFVAALTLVGAPLALGLVFFLLPALWFLGYIVAGARLGSAITRMVSRDSGEHPYTATAVGLLLFQLLVLVPALGVLLVIVAGVWGGGALAYTAFRSAGGKGFEPAPPAQPGASPEVQASA